MEAVSRNDLSAEPLLPQPLFDADRMRAYRRGRVLAEMEDLDIDLCLFTNPLTLRYVTEMREYSLFQSRIPTMTLLLARNGHTALAGSYNRGYPDVDEYIPSFLITPFDGGNDLAERHRAFADTVRARVGAGRKRIAVDRLDAGAVQALMQVGLEVVDSGLLAERARSVKSEDELLCIRHAIDVAQLGMQRMRDALRPGITENALWAILVATNTVFDGSWTDGRMLSSGPRTNPWLQEASDRAIEAGDVVAFDTDMIGPNGYMADISRTWVCEGKPPGDEIRDLYKRAHEEVSHNMGFVRAGMTFKEFSDRAFRQPHPYQTHRYPCVAHGVGMSDEYPKIAYYQDWDRIGYDGVIEQDMVLCIESFVGSDHGGPGVKLEQQVRVTESGHELLSTYPFEEELLR